MTRDPNPTGATQSLVTSRFAREVWGTCDGSIGYYGGASLLTQRCGKKAQFVQTREDGDGNHPRYCAECVKAA